MKYFFQKLTPFSQGINALDAADSNTDSFFEKYMYFFNSVEQDYLEHTEPITTLRTMICRNSIVHKLTKFSQGNYALDAPASNIDDFPCRDKCFSSNQLNRPVCSKQSLSPSETP
jgi:hypothetical protein